MGSNRETELEQRLNAIAKKADNIVRIGRYMTAATEKMDRQNVAEAIYDVGEALSELTAIVKSELIGRYDLPTD